MKNTQLKWAGLGIFAVCALTLVAWKGSNSTDPVGFRIRPVADTTPHRQRFREEIRAEDLDRAMGEVDKAMKSVDRDLRIDLSRMNKDLKVSLDEINKIDFGRINVEITNALKEVDWKQVRVDVKNAMKEVYAAIDSIDFSGIHTQVQAAVRDLADLKVDVHVDADKISREVEKGLSEAGVAIRKSKQELSNLKSLLHALESDGRIDPKKGYKVETRNGELYIDGVKQPKEVTDRYSKYFGEKDYSIRREGGELN